MMTGVASCQELRTVKLTAVEESGNPISGADATITFMGYNGQTTSRSKGKTDASGKFEASGNPELRMYAMLENKGYYSINSDRLSRKEDHDVMYIMRKIENPIPLYAKKVTLGLPLNRDWIGFDFAVGDWVAPHGNGKVNDAFFRCDTEKTGERRGRGKIDIKFPDNGGVKLIDKLFLQYCDLKMPHKAPAGDYKALMTRQSDSHHDNNFNEKVGYFFRSRVKMVNGKIISCHYGKILGNIRFDPRESGWHVSHKNKPKSFAEVSFTYYFNPTPNDHNLEFDVKRNLFQGLDTTEQVREP